MKKFLLLMCLSMAAVMVVSPAYATELWDPHLAGVDIGLAAGALPPPGFYLVHDSYFAPAIKPYNNLGHSSPVEEIFAYVDIPVLVWATGLKFLGADYGLALGQPFDYTNVRVLVTPSTSTTFARFETGQQWGTFGTIFVPGILAWKCGDWRIKGAFSVAFNDAMSSPGNVTETNGPIAPSGNGTTMFTPNIGISWLHAGWNISADLFYTFQTKNDATDYHSGQQFAADYTISYTCGKWTVGLGMSQEWQTTSDSFVVDGVYGPQPNTKASFFNMGPLLGYNFGPCSLMGVWQIPVSATENDVNCQRFFVRLVVPLGNPCPLGGK